MNQIDRTSKPCPKGTFTEKQGQYLAFIWAYGNGRITLTPPARLK
jgi:hypothetical protein